MALTIDQICKDLKHDRITGAEAFTRAMLIAPTEEAWDRFRRYRDQCLKQERNLEMEKKVAAPTLSVAVSGKHKKRSWNGSRRA